MIAIPNLLKLSLLLILFFTTLFSYSQKTQRIEPYLNPFIYRVGTNKQFVKTNHKYVDGRYNTPYIFETGLNYTVSYGKWGWNAGISFMSEQQSFLLTLYRPAEHFTYRPTDIYQFDFNSNSIGYKAGVNYKVNSKTHFTAGLNLFRPIFNGFGYHQDIQTVDLPIYGAYYPTQAQIEQGVEYVQYLTNIKSRDSRSYFSYTIPEFTINHEIFNNTFLTFGTRFKFWLPKLIPERFTIKVDGYLDDINAEFETFHESEITNKGFFMYLGLKYNIPLLRDKKLNPSKP